MSESNLLELPFAAPPPPEPGRVVVSDAFELLRGLAPESVDLVVTDPPYDSLQIHRARGTTTRLTTNWFSTVPNERLPELLREVYRSIGREADAASELQKLHRQRPDDRAVLFALADLLRAESRHESPPLQPEAGEASGESAEPSGLKSAVV